MALACWSGPRGGLLPFPNARAAALSAEEALRRLVQAPEHTPGHGATLLEWQGESYLGRVLRPYPEKPYIVFIERAGPALSDAVAGALARKHRLPRLRVHDRMDFTPWRLLLGLRGRDLCLLSGEDRFYCLLHRHPYSGRAYGMGDDGACAA